MPWAIPILFAAVLSLSVVSIGVAFALIYIALAAGRVPGLRIDRAGIAVAGGAAMLCLGALSPAEAARAVDFETLALLFGMMVVVAVLNIAGFFRLASEFIATHVSGRFTLLGVTIGVSGLLSAFLVNDVVCVALTSLILKLCRRLGLPPIPYLVGLATASNIGSVATITGNPQNIIIGSLSGIAYLRFAERLAPIALMGLVLNMLVVSFVYRRTLAGPVAQAVASADSSEPVVHRALLIKSVVVTLLAIGLFFAGFPTAIVALAAAGVLMLDRVRPEKIYRAVDWPLLILFAGLFVAVRGFELRVIHPMGLEHWEMLKQSPVVLVSGLAVVLSNLVSNVPAVLLFKPLIEAIPQKEQAWLALSMSSTLAGNLTLLGSVANLIVVESARREGVPLSFAEYLKVGVPLTILTTTMGIAWLLLTAY